MPSRLQSPSRDGLEPRFVFAAIQVFRAKTCPTSGASTPASFALCCRAATTFTFDGNTAPEATSARMAARTRLSPRCSKNRAFCIDGTVSSGPIHEAVGNILVGRVCLPRSVRPIGPSVIPLAVSLYAISPESGLTHPNHRSGAGEKARSRGIAGMRRQRNPLQRCALRLDSPMPRGRYGSVLRQRIDARARNPSPKRQSKESRGYRTKRRISFIVLKSGRNPALATIQSVTGKTQ